MMHGPAGLQEVCAFGVCVRVHVHVCVFAFDSAKHHKSWRTFHIQGAHKVREGQK